MDLNEPFATLEQPMLASSVKLELLEFPVMVSPKLDGFRCVMKNGVALSRKLKPIPNRFVQSQLTSLPDGFDGELVVGKPVSDPNVGEWEETKDGRVWVPDNVFRRTSSGVTSRDGEPDFFYLVFDRFNDEWPNEPFHERYSTVHAMCESGGLNPRVQSLPHWLVNDMAELMSAEEAVVRDGFEGLMIRAPNGAYKMGRSTPREGGLLKMKRFFDAEATVVDFVEQMTNTNEKERDERGYAKRSKKKAGLVPAGTLGALVCSTRLRSDGTLGPTGDGKVARFELGGGFTAKDRAELWARRNTDLIGSLHTFKFQEITPDGVPRFPVWKGERSRIDG